MHVKKPGSLFLSLCAHVPRDGKGGDSVQGLEIFLCPEWPKEQDLYTCLFIEKDKPQYLLKRVLKAILFHMNLTPIFLKLVWQEIQIKFS